MTDADGGPLDEIVRAVRAVAGREPARVALRAPDGDVRYAALDAALTAASVPGTGAGADVLGVGGTAADVVALLTRAVAGRSVLVLDGACTDWERTRAAALFAPPPDVPVLGLCTSGTGGLPTVVPLPWPGVLANAGAFARAAGFRDGDVVWCGTPLHHRFCLAAGVLAGLLAGATVLLLPGAVGPAELGPRLVEERVTVLLSVPFLYRLYVRGSAGDAATRRAWSLRTCVAAGEPLPPELAAQWRATTGLPLLSHYGTTEDGQISIGRGDADEGVGAPLADTEVRADADGVLAVRRRTGTPDAAGWRRTGDVGRVDVRGNVHVTGRATDRLNVAGKKVDPVEVEQALRLHPGVLDCVVAGLPGATGDEVVAFLAVSGPGGADAGRPAGAGGAEGPDDVALRRHLAGLLSPHKVPRRFVRVPEVPRTRTGKPRRGLLVSSLLAAAGGPPGRGP